MTIEQNTPQAPDRPMTRQYVHGLGAIGIVLAVLVGVPGWLLISSACGCVTPSDIVVYNADARPAILSWEHRGLLGTPLFGSSGTHDIPACAQTTASLPAGSIAATVSSASDAMTIGFVVPDGHDAYPIPMIIVREGGEVERLPASLPEDRVPGEGGCGD